MAASITFTGGPGLTPSRHPEDAKTDAVRLAPGTYLQGTVLGQITSPTAVNDVQTLTFTGTPTGGTFRISFNNQVTGPITYSTTNGTLQTNIQTAMDALPNSPANGSWTVVVTSSGTVATFTAAGAFAGIEQPLMTFYQNSLTGGSTPTAAFVHTTLGVTAGGHYAAYDDTKSDGRNVAAAILKYAATVNEQGQIVAGGGEWTTTNLETQAYTTGWFYTKQLVGLDAAGVTDLGKIYPTGGSLSAAGTELKIT